MKQKIKITTVNGDDILGYTWLNKKPLGNILIVTGMAEHAARYDEFATFLCDSGFNVYAFDHYGQGLNAPSDEMLGVVPRDFFTKEVDLIDLIVSKFRSSLLPTYLFGHSMGSFIIQEYIQKYPNHVNKIILCGSNGPNGKTKYKFGKLLTKLITHKSNRDKPCHLMNVLTFGGYVKSIKDHETNFDWLSSNKENVQNYMDDHRCGYCSSYRFFYEFMRGLARLYKNKRLKKIRKDMNILIVSGSDDPVGSFSYGPISLQRMYEGLGIENVKLKLYEGKRHELLNEENRHDVYCDILKFLKEKCPPAEKLI